MKVVHLSKEGVQANLQELEELARLASYPVHFPRCQVFIIREGKVIAGCGVAQCIHGFWFLRMGVVRPEFRGQRMQSALIKARLRYLKTRRAKKASSWVRPDNVHSLNNLVENGFRFEKGTREFNGQTHLRLAKWLQ